MPVKKPFGVICIGAALLAFLIAVLLLTGLGSSPNITPISMDYEDRIFDTARIHRIDIYIDDWQTFLEASPQEEYSNCSVGINGEPLDNVGLRANKNSFSTTPVQMDTGRYSFELEFNHYDSGQTYFQLDKLYLNNLHLDNTMMKACLTYRMMKQIGVAAPLCSYTTVYVNGSALGLYLAVEAIDESFLLRNFGADYGQLYQPSADSQSSAGDDHPEDVMLQYLGDDPDRYPNIFKNAKTHISAEDEARLIQALKQLSTGNRLKNALDVEAVIRYFAAHNFLCNEDSYTGETLRNFYLYEKDGKLSMLPWGYNLAYGGIPTGNASAVVNTSIYAPVSAGKLSERPMLARILESKKYTWLYERYYMEILKIDMETLIEQTEKMIAPYVLRDPSRFCSYADFETGVQTLKQFLKLRCESIQQQIYGKTEPVDVGDLDLSKMGGVTNS